MDATVGMTQGDVADLRRTVLMAQAVQRDEPGDWSDEMTHRLQRAGLTPPRRGKSYAEQESEFDRLYAESGRPVADLVGWDL